MCLHPLGNYALFNPFERVTYFITILTLNFADKLEFELLKHSTIQGGYELFKWALNSPNYNLLLQLHWQLGKSGDFVGILALLN